MQGGIHRLAGQAFGPSRLALEPRVMFDGAVTTTLVSVASDGTPANAGPVDYASVSADGRFVAFASNASNLIAGDNNGIGDIFVKDTNNGNITRVSVATDGTESNGVSSFASISADGRYVVFASSASNLVPGDTNGTSDIFVHDTLTGTTSRVSLASDGSEANGESAFGVISGGGRFVAFISQASNLVVGDMNASMDAFVHDLQSGVTTRVSVASDGTEGNGDVTGGGFQYISISADGRYVAFASQADNMAPGDVNGSQDVFVRDTILGVTSAVNISNSGSFGTGYSLTPSISSDGRYVVFESNSTNIVPETVLGSGDIFIRDLVAGTTKLVSISADGMSGGNDQSGWGSAVSQDGRYVVFSSAAQNLLSTYVTTTTNIFQRDMQSGVTTLLSKSSNGLTDGDGVSIYPAMTPDGRYVVFVTGASDMVAGANTSNQIIMKDFGPPFTPLPPPHVSPSTDHGPATPSPDRDDGPFEGGSISGSYPSSDAVDVRDSDAQWGEHFAPAPTSSPEIALASQNFTAVVDAMNNVGLSIADQRVVMQRMGADAIVQGLTASGDPFARDVGSLLAQVRDGQHVEMAEVKRALLQAGADPNTVMSYLLAYFEVEKAARTEALSAALGEIVRNPAVADAFAKVNAASIKDIPLSSPRVALLIGVADYANPLARLTTPVADVTALKEVLASRFGYQTFTLIDPTKQDIVDWIASLASRLKEDGSLVIYYAGHGYLVDSTGVGYWLPADASAKTAANWISTKDLSNYLSHAQAKQVMVISDSCYSGSLTKESRLVSDAVGVSRDQIFSRKAVMAMSSGGEEPVRDDGYNGHSVFAGNLLKALSESKSDDLGFILFNDVRAGVTKDVPQVPTYGAILSAGHEGGTDFVLGGRR